MRFIIPILFCVLLVSNSCKKSKNKSVPESNTTLLNVDNLYENNFRNSDAIEGVYTAKFGDNNLVLHINHVGPRSVVGYNVVNELRRNVYGFYEKTDTGIHVYLREPGDHEYDGRFHIFFKNNPYGIYGNWQPYKSSKANAKSFTLTRIQWHGNNAPIFNTDTLKAITFNEFTLKCKDKEQIDKNYFLQFKKDGKFVWRYYNNFYDDKEQIKIVNGTWSIENSKIHMNMPFDIFFNSADVFAKIEFHYVNYDENNTTIENEMPELESITLKIQDTLEFNSYIYY